MDSEKPSRQTHFYNNDKLVASRETLARHGISPESILKVEADNWQDAYFQVGAEFADPIRNSFDEVFSKTTDEAVKSRDIRLKVARSLSTRLSDLASGDNEISGDVKDLVDSLNGWARGAGLDKEAEKYGLTPLEAALVLENDNVGCQSFMARTGDGGVIAMHTEEDEHISSRVTKYHQVELTVKGQKRSSFAYNNLLPGGAASGESEGFVMLTDFLRTNTLGEKNGFDGLVNASAWIIWKMGKEVTLDKIKSVIDATGPFIDGYAVNVIRRTDEGNIEAHRIYMLGDTYAVETLGAEPGSHLEQTNLIDPKYKEENPELYAYAQEPYSVPQTSDKMYKGYYTKYLKRINRIKEAAQRWKPLLERNMSQEDETEIHKTINGIMSLRRRFNWGFANTNVAAYRWDYLGKEKQTGMTGIGAASR